MKKYFYLLLAAALFAGCSDDNDDETIQPGTGTEQPGDNISQSTEEWDYASCLGMNLMQALGKFGDTPAMDMGTMKMYQYEGGKVIDVMLIFNDNEQLYMISASLTENAVTADEMKAYFGSRYMLIDENSGTYTLGDEDEDGTGDAEEVSYCYLTYADNADANLATVTVNIMVEDASATIIYMNPQLVPDLEENPDTITMNGIALINEFMGQSIADVLDEYDGLFVTINGEFYCADVTDDYVQVVGLFVTDGIVDRVRLLCDDITDDEVKAYCEENGSETITLDPVVDDETGVSYPHYEFRNTEAGYTVDYIDGIITVSRI